MMHTTIRSRVTEIKNCSLGNKAGKLNHGIVLFSATTEIGTKYYWYMKEEQLIVQRKEKLIWISHTGFIKKNKQAM